MAYGPDVSTGFTSYQLTLIHTPTGVRIACHLDDLTGAPTTDAVRAAVFQAFLTKVASIPDCTIVGATRTSSSSNTITP